MSKGYRIYGVYQGLRELRQYSRNLYNFVKRIHFGKLSHKNQHTYVWYETHGIYEVTNDGMNCLEYNYGAN